jgi:hypothetical protein
MQHNVTCGDALRKLAREFTRVGRSVPELQHASVLSNHPLTLGLLRRILPRLAEPGADATRYARPKGRFRYSCFFGDAARRTEFQALATEAFEVVSEVLSKLQEKAPCGELDPLPRDAWLDIVYRGHELHPEDSALSWDRKDYYVWGIHETAPHIVDDKDIEEPVSFEYYLEQHPPDAWIEVQSLRPDVFTASAALLNVDLKDLHDLTLASAAEPAKCNSNSESIDSQATSASDSRGTEVTLPAWASYDDFIGPATNQEFAVRVMKISVSTLDRRVKAGIVIRRTIKGDRGNLFLHTDQVLHKRYKAAFEALGSKQGARASD